MLRCDLSDLPVDACACRIHKPGQEADAHPAVDRSGTPGAEVEARYPGRCVTCGEPFDVGEPIRPVTTMFGTRWGHGDCLS